MNYKHISTLTLALILSIYSIQAQVGDKYHGITSQNLSKEYNVITTAVPFMTITPDSRAGGMGDVGVATSSDVWSQSWNASKYALSEKDMSAGISYTPWLENMGIKDINLIYAAGYKKIKQTEAVGASLRYFSLGEIPAYEDNGDLANYTISPKEYAFDVSYSRYLSDFFVMGMTGRFIYSNLTGDTDPDYKPGKSVAADISGTFFKDLANNSLLTLGFNVSNLGSKIAYSSTQKDFIPTNLKIGAGYKMDIDNYNKIGFYLDINKLLVPTPPK
ncbi:MAG TPA: type IX secretion system outer membrane channel protein PorV, partial [Bacteroidales bacterium]|nr:type IX secretion system outer membrane channel protein PorV [Bacteroidales bacterium]